MDNIPEKLDIVGVPLYVESWNVAKIPGFVSAVLKRWQRSYGELPQRFYIVMCPQVEINTMGGLPTQAYELTDPRLRCQHFTGCHKPYFVVILTGDDADWRRAEIQRLLPWSEGYEVKITEQAIHLTFTEASEDLGKKYEAIPKHRTLQQLLETGELISILE
jgi:hypothetical protein